MFLYADDIVLFCEDIDELNDILNIYDSNFSRVGLTIAIDKTQTLAYNVSEDVMSSINRCYLLEISLLKM